MPPPLVPPLRFAMVEEGIYRGAYPSLINLRFLARLRLKTVISLLPEPPSADLVRWCEEEGIALQARLEELTSQLQASQAEKEEAKLLMQTQQGRLAEVERADGGTPARSGFVHRLSHQQH